ncbi:MAG: DUF1330 domain-containing protein [Hyphomicrobiales bacterium]|nr:DUF1330 domain-containing protein [Hyphomicrobiales bacterium]MBV9751556.1 DUF1330 domain-containing protein [Hyphomicrobiales bacterium]
MAGYLIANIRVRDHKGFEEYRNQVAPLIARFKGRYLVRGGELRPLEGNPIFERLVVLEFPSLAEAQRFYDSPEYAPLKELRLSSASSDVILVDGYSA